MLKRAKLRPAKLTSRPIQESLLFARRSKPMKAKKSPVTVRIGKRPEARSRRQHSKWHSKWHHGRFCCAKSTVEADNRRGRWQYLRQWTVFRRWTGGSPPVWIQYPFEPENRNSKRPADSISWAPTFWKKFAVSLRIWLHFFQKLFAPTS